jgi:hypothetical protein
METLIVFGVRGPARGSRELQGRSGLLCMDLAAPIKGNTALITATEACDHGQV